MEFYTYTIEMHNNYGDLISSQVTLVIYCVISYTIIIIYFGCAPYAYALDRKDIIQTLTSRLFRDRYVLWRCDPTSSRNDAFIISIFIPHKKVESIPKEYAGIRHFFCTQLELYCYCMMPETYDDTVECEAWYHLKCTVFI